MVAFLNDETGDFPELDRDWPSLSETKYVRSNWYCAFFRFATLFINQE